MYMVTGAASWVDTCLGWRALSLHAAFLGSKGHLWQHCQIWADSSVRGEQMQAKIPELRKWRLGLKDVYGHNGSSIIIKNEPLQQFASLSFVHSIAFSPLYIPSPPPPPRAGAWWYKWVVLHTASGSGFCWCDGDARSTSSTSPPSTPPCRSCTARV